MVTIGSLTQKLAGNYLVLTRPFKKRHLFQQDSSWLNVFLFWWYILKVPIIECFRHEFLPHGWAAHDSCLYQWLLQIAMDGKCNYLSLSKSVATLAQIYKNYKYKVGEWLPSIWCANDRYSSPRRLKKISWCRECEQICIAIWYTVGRLVLDSY